MVIFLKTSYIRIFLTLLIAFIVSFSSASADTLSELKKLYSTLVETQSHPLYDYRGVYKFLDQPYKVYLDKNDQLAIKTLSPKELVNEKVNQETNSYRENFDSRDKDRFKGIWPDRAQVIYGVRNRNHKSKLSISNFRNLNGELVLAGCKKGTDESFIIKTFPASSHTDGFYHISDDYVSFHVQNVVTLEMVYTALINMRTGHITELDEPHHAVFESKDSLYFTKELGGDLYSISRDFDGLQSAFITKVWENTNRQEILDVTHFEPSDGIDISILKLREYGRDSYKVFSGLFECEIKDVDNIINGSTLGNIEEILDSNSNRAIDSENLYFAADIEDNDKAFPRKVIKRWNIEQSGPPITRQKADNKSLRQELFKKISSLFTFNKQARKELERELGINNLDDYLKNQDFSNTEETHKLIQKILETIFPDRDTDLLYKTIKKDCEIQDTPLELVEQEIEILDYNKVISTELPKPYSVSVIGKDGTRIPVNIYPPHIKDKNKPAPIILHIHGGPSSHIDANNLSYGILLQGIASKGYWVVCPETRGSTGYGASHQDALKGNWGKNHIEDIIAVAEYCKKTLPLEKDNIFLMGSSFGGYTTLSMATNPKHNTYFKGYVPIALISNVGKEFSNPVDNNSEQQTCADYWNYLVGKDVVNSDWDNNKDNIEISPIYHLKNIKRPVQIIHGTADNNTLPFNALDVRDKADKLNIPVNVMMIEGLTHDFDRGQDFESYVEKPLEFFEKLRKNVSFDQCLDASNG